MKNYIYIPNHFCCHSFLNVINISQVDLFIKWTTTITKTHTIAKTRQNRWLQITVDLACYLITSISNAKTKIHRINHIRNPIQVKTTFILIQTIQTLTCLPTKINKTHTINHKYSSFRIRVLTRNILTHINLISHKHRTIESQSHQSKIEVLTILDQERINGKITLKPKSRNLIIAVPKTKNFPIKNPTTKPQLTKANPKMSLTPNPNTLQTVHPLKNMNLGIPKRNLSKRTQFLTLPKK